MKTADSYTTVSTCAPVNDKACSLSIDGKPLLMLLHTYQKGAQYVRELGFSNPTTENVMKEFVTIARSLNR